MKAHIPEWSPKSSGAPRRKEVVVSGCVHACAGDLCGVSGVMMSVRLMAGVRDAGLALRASRDGLMRTAAGACAGQRLHSSEVSAPPGLWKTRPVHPECPLWGLFST